MSEPLPTGDDSAKRFTNTARLATSLAAAVLIGITTASIQAVGFAPLLITPIIAGTLLGFLLARLIPFGSYRQRAAAVVCLAIVAVAVEHLWLYRDYRHRWHQIRAEQPALAVFRPDEQPRSLPVFFRDNASRSNVIFWTLDATLVIATTTIVATMMAPQSKRL